MSTQAIIMATVVVAIGTFAFRYAGPVLRSRISMSTYADRVLAIAVVVLLAGLFATSTLYDGYDFAGYARPAGVIVGGVLAWRRAPFVAVIVAAAATAAVLRLLGVP